MDENTKYIIKMKVEKTIENLKKNNMDAYYADKKEDVISLIDSILNEGETIANGGSVTLKETGVLDYLRSGRFNFLDRYAKDAKVNKIFREAFSADTYFTSSNAITEEGELYNLDGNGNRVAAMIFGPKKVIVIAGYNKIVKDIEHARDRVKNYVAPANAMRLNLNTPCSKIGKCIDCKSEEKICCAEVILGYQMKKGRIKVIIVGEELGY